MRKEGEFAAMLRQRDEELQHLQGSDARISEMRRDSVKKEGYTHTKKSHICVRIDIGNTWTERNAGIEAQGEKKVKVY